MSIRTAIVSVLALAAAGCGTGNWSNEDLEFLNALPAKADLQSQVPTDTNKAGLTGGGIAQRRDGLVGDRSTTYQEAVASSDGFNAGLDALLTVVETVRSYPPSLREGTRRVWGPYPADKAPGFDARVVMDRTNENEFAYRIEFSKKGTNVWVALLKGEFLASSGVRKGVGSLTLLAKDARAQGVAVPADLDKLDTLDITYSTVSDPVYVAMSFKLMPPATPVTYESRRYDDKRGRISFVLPGLTIDKLVGPQTVMVSTIWAPSGEGRAEMKILAGTGIGLAGAECWDETFVTRWTSSTWGGASGVESQACKDLGAQLKQ